MVATCRISTICIILNLCVSNNKVSSRILFVVVVVVCGYEHKPFSNGDLIGLHLKKEHELIRNNEKFALILAYFILSYSFPQGISNMIT